MQIISTKYTTTITVSKSPKDVFNCIIDLKNWWVEEFSGEKLKLNTIFDLKIGDGHYSKNKIIEFIPNKKFSWVTIQSLRVIDNFDWTGTKMIFELSPNDYGTIITFTYDGVIFESDQNKLKEICDYCIKFLLYNHLESFTTSIVLSKSKQEVFNCLTEVKNWWNNEDFKGNCKILNDEFDIHHPGQHFSRQKLIEVIPDIKIVWLITDSNLHWLQSNKQEWTNTKIIFEISTMSDKTILNFTHLGLTPEKECYAVCEKGWTLIIKDWLVYFINKGSASPELTKASEIRNKMLDDNSINWFSTNL